MNRRDFIKPVTTIRFCLLTALLAIGTILLSPALTAQPASGTVNAVEPFEAGEISGIFYRNRQDASAWADDELFEQLLQALASLSDHGLDPAHYHLQQLEKWRNDRQAREHYATDAWFAAAGHMLNGKLDPVTINPDWTARGREADLAAQV